MPGTGNDQSHLESGLSATLERGAYEEVMIPLIDRIVTTVAGVLQQAGLAPDQVDTLYFTGGASGMPWLREQIAALLPNAQRVEGNRFGSIGCGLALEAAKRYG